jgi:hypothetical protein
MAWEILHCLSVDLAMCTLTFYCGWVYMYPIQVGFFMIQIMKQFNSGTTIKKSIIDLIIPETE